MGSLDENISAGMASRFYPLPPGSREDCANCVSVPLAGRTPFDPGTQALTDPPGEDSPEVVVVAVMKALPTISPSPRPNGRKR